MAQLNAQDINEQVNAEVKEKIVYDFIKRVMDIVGSIVGLILLSPVFLILFILVKIDSRGPVFFSHTRLGYKGKPIKIYKFRSMVINAEEMLKNLTPEQKEEFEKNFKLEDDPRITKMGDILRRTSLDELPQLVNILKGELSIVGPRPIVEKEIELYGQYGAKFLAVKPGLTGNWQANGRSDTTYDERVQLDMDYIDNRSLWLDIKIILKTFVSVFKREGAR